jgi:hypothetical protein
MCSDWRIRDTPTDLGSARKHSLNSFLGEWWTPPTNHEAPAGPPEPAIPQVMDRNGGKPPPPAAWKDGAVTYLHLLFYIAISGGQIFFNKASRS